MDSGFRHSCRQVVIWLSSECHIVIAILVNYADRCATERQDDGKMHERKKETRIDEQYVSENFLRVNKEASGRQMSVKNTEVMEVIDLLKQQYTRRRRRMLTI